MDKYNLFDRLAILSFATILIQSSGFASDYRWMTVGSLRNWFSDAGCEIEVGRRKLVRDQQDGFIWPAQYTNQDMQAAKGLWIGTTNYTDTLNSNTFYPYKVVHVGPRVLNEDTEFMPVRFKLVGKFEHPVVLVNGVEASNESDIDQVDTIDPTLACDRMLINVINTSIGITVTRKIYASSNTADDDYFIQEYVFKNSGIYDQNGDVQTKTLTDVVFFYQYRLAINKEVGAYGYGIAPQAASWGLNTVNDVLHPNYGDDIRAILAWHGLYSSYGCDNIGGPNIGSSEIIADGRLCAAQFPGIVVLHADKSPTDKTDDLSQPFSTPYFSSDATYTSGNSQFDASLMQTEYSVMTSGHPTKTHADEVGTGDAALWCSSNTGGSGGITQGMGFGPYTLAPGDSIRIVLAECAAGLSREKCETVGAQWYQQSSPYTMPEGSTTTDRDEFKDAWVFTGKDSLRNTFNRAITTWQNGLNYEQLPPPPSVFEVISDSNQIVINWSKDAESYTNFKGYRLYRSTGTSEGPYICIFDCDKSSNIVNTYSDTAVEKDTNYYYYIASYDDGTVGTTTLESSLFWTRTNTPANLISSPLIFSDVYIDPRGDDSNNGTSSEKAFKTITHALNKIAGSKLKQQTIHLAGGLYNSETTGESFPITINKNVNIEGDPNNRAILDAQSGANVITINSKVKTSLSDIMIINGENEYGGGLKVGASSSVELSGLTIRYNKAAWGGGIYIDSCAEVKFDSQNLCNIYSNQARYIGDEIYGIGSDTVLTVLVDTFTVLKPCDYLVYPCENYSINAKHAIVIQFSSDLYVAPNGNDGNTGTDSASPLKTIRQAIIKSDPDVSQNIILSDGIYSPSTTGETFPIRGFSNLIISGSDNNQSILNAEQTGSVIYIDNDSNLTIKNLVLKNGSSTSGGGIGIINSNPCLENLIITENYAVNGGGIACLNQTNPQVRNLRIINNKADYGGAIYFTRLASAYFDSSDRCNIYSNTATYGAEFWADNLSNPITVFLDTFTVYYLTEDYVMPLNSFNINIKTGLIPQIESDLFISPTIGNDENSGISKETPLKTIAKALELIFADEQRPHTINLEAGTYCTAVNGEQFPIIAKSYVSIIGDTAGVTVIDAANANNVVVFDNVTKAGISHVQIINGQSTSGGGIYCFASEVTLNDLVISNNSASNGAGLYADNLSQVTINRSEFAYNTATYKGGAIYSNESNIYCYRVLIDSNVCKSDAIFLSSSESEPDYKFVNLTIVDNIYSSNYGGIRCSGNANGMLITNTILRSDCTIKIYLFDKSALILTNSNIEGILTGVKGNGTIKYSDQIADYDPLFVGGIPYDYHLSESSGCVDQGLTLLVLEGDTLINLTDSEFEGNAPDLGALESPYSNGISDPDKSIIPDKFMLLPNYPNPFNATTIINYALPQDSKVEINIYDLNGRLVKKLVNEKQSRGYQTVSWNGTNQFGKLVGSGLYIYTMSTPTFVKSRKLVLIK